MTLPAIQRKMALIYNPHAGAFVSWRKGRAAQLVEALRHEGIEAELHRSMTPAEALHRAREATRRDCSAIVACGGDGTLNALLQAAVAGDVTVPIGVVPFGSGNLFAAEVGMAGSLRVAAAELAAAKAVPLQMGVARHTNPEGYATERYFAVAAGAGADARVICGVNSGLKSSLGMGSYYAEAMRQLLFTRDPFRAFAVEFIEMGSGSRRRERVTQLIAERVDYFGRCLAPGNGFAGIRGGMLRLIMFLTDQRASYFAYGARLLAQQLGAAPSALQGVEVAYADQVYCYPADGTGSKTTPVLCEVDGELVGELPAELGIAPAPVAILMPSRKESGHAAV